MIQFYSKYKFNFRTINFIFIFENSIFEKVLTFNKNEYPIELKKKINILDHFIKYF
jgi:hypothetical protein